MVDALRYSVESYVKNVKMVSFFSLPFLLAFLIPLFSPTPTYVALGGTFLRTGSMYVDLTSFDVAIIVLSFLVSLFLVSFAIVAINLLIKSQRTFTNIRTEIMQGIERYTLNVFWLYLTAWVLCFVVNLLGYEYGVNEWLTPLFSLLVSLPLFYAPTAIVIDEQRPWQAMKGSVMVVFKRFPYFLLIVALGVAALSLVDALFIALHTVIPYARYLVLVANALFILPFLIMMQVQVYLTKYTILK